MPLFTHTLNVHEEDTNVSNKFRLEALTIIFFGGFTGILSNPCPSLPSIATDGRRQFPCLNIVLNNNKTGPLFLVA